MTNLYLMRHGETNWNRQKITQGCTDTELSKKGLLQAEILARRLISEDISAIYSSDLKRAYTTAEIVGEALCLEVNKRSDFREMNFGQWEGLRADSIKREYSDIHRLWISDPGRAVIPGAEELIQVKDRSVKAIKGIMGLHRGENIALISHGITLKCLILGLLGIDIGNLSKIRIDNCSISVLQSRQGYFTLDCLNDTCHMKGCPQ